MAKTDYAKSKSLSTDSSNIAAAYIRVSTKAQEAKGYSLEVQKENALKYAQSEGLLLDESFIFDEARPASKVYGDDTFESYDLDSRLDHRPQLQRILELSKEKKFNHLIIYTRDRLARNTEEFIALNLFFKRRGIKIHYSKPGEFTESKNENISEFLEIILGSVAELEANTIATRVKAGNRQCVEEGLWPGGKIPFGFAGMSKGKKNSTLKAAGYEKQIVEEIFKYYNQGLGYKRIADIMSQQHNSYKWSKRKVELIITNETYTGQIVWDRRGGRRKPGKHNSILKSPLIKGARIIDESQWKDTIELRQRKLECNDPKYFDTPFLLKGKLICGKCGEYMKTKNNGKRKKSVYRCPTCGENGISELIIEKDLIEERFLKELYCFSAGGNTEELWRLYLKKSEVSKSSCEASIKKLQGMIDSKEKARNDIHMHIQREQDIELKEMLRMEYVVLSKVIADYEAEISRLSETSKRYFTTAAQFKSVVDKIFKHYSGMSSQGQRMMVDILVESITVDRDENGITMSILLNPPKEKH